MGREDDFFKQLNKQKGRGRGHWEHRGRPGQRGGSLPGSGTIGSAITSDDSELAEVFARLEPTGKLNPNLFHNVVSQTIINNSSRLLRDMAQDEETRERALQVIQNETTGDLTKQEVVGEFGSTKLPRVPDGYRRVGLFHTHPPGHPAKTSEPDMWKFNPMLRTGGIFAIGGYRGGRPFVNVWTVYPGDREPRTPATVELA